MRRLCRLGYIGHRPIFNASIKGAGEWWTGVKHLFASSMCRPILFASLFWLHSIRTSVHLHLHPFALATNYSIRNSHQSPRPRWHERTTQRHNDCLSFNHFIMANGGGEVFPLANKVSNRIYYTYRFMHYVDGTVFHRPSLCSSATLLSFKR